MRSGRSIVGDAKLPAWVGLRTNAFDGLDQPFLVVGSAVVNQIAEHGQSPELVGKVSEFVKSLADALKSI